MVDVPKKPAGGPFSEWLSTVFRALSEDKIGCVGRGGVLNLAGYMWKQMSEAEKNLGMESSMNTPLLTRHTRSRMHMWSQRRSRNANTAGVMLRCRSTKTVRTHQPLPPEKLLRQCTEWLSIRCSNAEHIALNFIAEAVRHGLKSGRSVNFQTRGGR